jgi:hypothetical protein
MDNKRVPDTKTKWAIERRSQYNLNLSWSVSEVLVDVLAENCGAEAWRQFGNQRKGNFQRWKPLPED